MTEKRLKHIDILKGIAIIAVVIGHTSPPGGFSKFLYAWHMPIFFTITGYLYNSEKWGYDFRGFIKSRAKSYLIPYYAVGISTLILNFIEFYFIDHRFDFLKLVKNNIYGILYCKAGSDYLINCVPIWYLMCAFVSSLLFYFIIRISQKFDEREIVIVIFCILLVILNCVIIGHDIGPLPLKVDSALFAVPFMLFGYEIKEKNIEERMVLKYLGIEALMAIMFAEINPSYVHFAENRYGNLVFMFIGSIFSIAAIWTIAFKLKECRVIEFFGRNSIIIVCMNYYIIHLIVRAEYIFELDYYKQNWIISLFLVFIGLLFSIFIFNTVKKIAIFHKIKR